MPSIESNPSKNIVVQDNQLIEASYTLTLNEKRLILLGASKIDSRKIPRKETPLEFDVTADEWAAAFPGENPFQQIKRAADKMLTRYVTLHPKTGHIQKLAWFDSVHHFEGEARVRVRFGWSISLRLAGLLDQFTKIDLLSVRQLNSFHSIRLYELISQFEATGFRVISLEDFRIAMDCVKTYPLIADLKKRVLNPALNEINAKTGVEILCKDRKRGRKIIGFEFVTRIRKQKDLFKD